MDNDSLLALTGRVLLAVLYLAAAFGKISNFDATTQYVRAHGLPWPGLFCAAAVLVEALGGLSLLLGYHTRWSALALFAFTIPVTLLFHVSPDQRVHFLKNLAVMGGLLQVAAHDPGEFSLDHGVRS